MHHVDTRSLRASEGKNIATLNLWNLPKIRRLIFAMGDLHEIWHTYRTKYVPSNGFKITSIEIALRQGHLLSVTSV